MPGVGIIVNPHASGNRRRPHRVARMRAILGEEGEVVATDGLETLDQALVRFRDRAVDLVAVCGGDGSVHHVLTRMVPIWGQRPLPAILPLRAGTMNDLAATVGCGLRAPEAALARLVEDRRHGRAPNQIERNLIRVNGSGYGYIVGAGLIVNFLRLYYQGRRPGRLRALWLLVLVGCSWLVGSRLVHEVCDPIEATVESDGRALSTDRYTLLIAGSILHIGLGVKPFYRSAVDGRWFHLLAGGSTPGELLGRLWRFYRGRPSELASLHDVSARRVRIRFASPCAYTINGELFDPVRVLELDLGPRITFVGC